MSTKKLTTEDFISRAKSIHGDKFSYDEVDYKNMTTKVILICNVCQHKWYVNPANHVGPRKSGCPSCKRKSHIKRNMKNKKTTKQFIKEAEEKLPQYNYSKTFYKNCKTKVTLTCNIHGDFQKWPNDVLHGSGCPRCGNSFRKTTTEFVYEAKSIFPRFDYSRVIYKNAHTKVIIICPDHGEFLQKPNAILNKVGCEKCSVARVLKTKIENKIIRHPSQVSNLEKYRRGVWKISNLQFKKYFNEVNPQKYKRGLEYHLDHKYPIQQGFINDIDPKIIGHWTNLQIIPAEENRKKSHILHGKTIEELYEDYYENT